MKYYAVIAAVLAGCYGPHPNGGVCTTSTDCPASLPCVNGTCGGVGLDGAADGVVDGVVDGDPSCTCTSADTLTCSSGPTTCDLGCVAETPARCARVVPSNGVDANLVAMVDMGVNISTGVASFDTDTGAITGAIVRAAGEGTLSKIGYKQMPTMGVFVFDTLTLQSPATITFTGTRAAVFLVTHNATINGTIDGSGGIATRATPGPGGGAGGTYLQPAGGCGPGAAGASSVNSDAGGGGGGGAATGAKGGDAGVLVGGSKGIACIASDLQPLVGGSGGGGGGRGDAAVLPVGGGGGGALQITALNIVHVTGTITMGGGGGAVGAGTTNFAAGGGGGAGGAILLEGIFVSTDTTMVLAANGGGGGAGGDAAAATAAESGHASTTPAAGGIANSDGDGGKGGADGMAALPGQDANTGANGGGGGGGVGRILLRSKAQNAPSGTLSPMAGSGPVVFQ